MFADMSFLFKVGDREENYFSEYRPSRRWLAHPNDGTSSGSHLIFDY